LTKGEIDLRKVKTLDKGSFSFIDGMADLRARTFITGADFSDTDYIIKANSLLMIESKKSTMTQLSKAIK
jgi:hypothetical protein